MPSQQLIHVNADIPRILDYALGAGFRVAIDGRSCGPRPKMLGSLEAHEAEPGAFFLVRPEWVFGPMQMSEISSGHYAGKYFLQPRVNFTGISLYFRGEGAEGNRRRLGDGFISWHREWLEMPAKVLHLVPSEVEVWYSDLARQLLSRVAVKAGVHSYKLTRGVLSDEQAAECLPPFDFIPWSVDLFKGRSTK